MKLGELRKFMKFVESLDDDTTVFFDYCGWTSDDDYCDSIKISDDGECTCVWMNFCGNAYEVGGEEPKIFYFDNTCLAVRATYEQGNEEAAIRTAFRDGGRKRPAEEVAAILGISMRTLFRKMNTYNIKDSDDK